MSGERKDSMSKRKQTILISLVFLIGLSIFLYPIIGNVLNKLKNNWEISQYEEVIQATEPSIYDEMFEEARIFNESLSGIPTVYEEEDPFYLEYKEALSLTGGMMGYLIIEDIDVNLAIYFGTSDDVLQNAVGYLEGTHLPTGDIGNSTVLTGHTGLPSANLLSDIDQLEIGDTFQLVILNQIFTYEVFEVNTVLPYEVELVEPREGIDMVTLVTCTPYGVNSHRLLVHAKQVATVEDVVLEFAEIEKQYTVMNLVPIIAVPIILILIIWIVSVHYKERKRKHRKRDRGGCK